MTIQLNAYSKNASWFFSSMLVYLTNGAQVIRVWPDTVPLPSTCPVGIGDLPAGYIIELSDANFNLGTSGNSLVFTSGSLTANTTAAGTFGWWALFGGTGATNHGGMISDSIGTTAGNILTVSNMSPGNGDAIVFGFNLTVV